MVAAETSFAFWFPIPPLRQCLMGKSLGGQMAHLGKQRLLEMLGTEVETPAPPHTSRVISDKSLYPSGLPLSHLKIGD